MTHRDTTDLLISETQAFIDSLGDLDHYERALAALALELSASMATALAAAPVAKQLTEVLSTLQERKGATGPVTKLDELTERRKRRAAGE